MKNLTDTEAFATVTCLEDGDDVEGASTEPSLQALANRTAYLNTRRLLAMYTDDDGLGGGAFSHTGNTNWVDVTGKSISLGTLRVGDLVHVDVMGNLSTSNASQAARWRIVVNDGTTDNVVTSSELATSYTGGAIEDQQRACAGKWTVASATAHTVKLQAKISTGAETVTLRDYCVLRAFVWRAP